MRKEYTKPVMTCFELNTEAIIALSVQDQEINKGNQDQFEMYGRNEDKVNNPNIWEQMW